MSSTQNFIFVGVFFVDVKIIFIGNILRHHEEATMGATRLSS